MFSTLASALALAPSLALAQVLECIASMVPITCLELACMAQRQQRQARPQQHKHKQARPQQHKHKQQYKQQYNQRRKHPRHKQQYKQL